jgi:beta-glucosidase
MAKKQLRKFERIALKRGESKTIIFNLEASEDLRYYGAMYRKYMVESGSFEIQIGASSEDIRLKEIISVEE